MKISFNYVVPRSKLNDLKSELSHKGAELDNWCYQYEPTNEEPEMLSHSDRDPFMVLHGTSKLDALINSVVGKVRREATNGIIMNATGRDLLIKENPEIEQGRIAISTMNGLMEYDMNARNANKQSIIEMLKLGSLKY